jgi:hypothetical protein
LADIDTSSSAIGFTPGSTHASLKSTMQRSLGKLEKKISQKHGPIGSGATQHLINPQDMEGVYADA